MIWRVFSAISSYFLSVLPHMNSALLFFTLLLDKRDYTCLLTSG